MKSFFPRAVLRRSRLLSSAVACHFNSPEPLEARIAPAAVVWINAAGGDWKDGANWSGGVAPTDQDDVSIPDFPGTITITITTGAQHAKTLTAAENLAFTGGSLELGGASSITGGLSLFNTTLMVDGALDVTGSIAWNGGVTLIGAGSVRSHGTVTYAANDTLNVNFNNAGIFNLTSGAVNFGVAVGVSFTNQVGGVFNVTGTHTLNIVGDFANAGTLNNVSGTSLHFGPLTNTGTLHVLAGEYDLRGDTLNSGSYNVDAGATLGFMAGGGPNGHHIAAGGLLNGTGRYLVAGFARLTVDAGSATIRTLQLDEFSQAGGAGDIVIPSGGVVTWNGGQLFGAGRTIVQAGAVVNASGGESLEDHELELSGTLNLNAALLNLHEQSTLNVLSGGVVNLFGHVQLTGSGASLLTVVSGGAINSNAPGDSASISASNASISGSVHSIAGTLVILTPLTTVGSFTNDAGAGISFSGFLQNYTMQPGTTWSGAGHFFVNQNTTLTIAAGLSLSVADLQVNGTLTGAGDYTVPTGGVLTFPIGGTMSGTGKTTIANGGTLSVGGAGAATLSVLDRTVENAGTISVKGTLGNGTNAVLNNNGLVEFTGSGSQGLTARFTVNNNGILRVGPASTSFTFDGVLHNDGLFDVQGGQATIQRLNVVGTPTSTGEFRSGTGATISFASAVFSFNAGTTWTGAGAFAFTQGTLTFNDPGLTYAHPNTSIVQVTLNGPGGLVTPAGATWAVSGLPSFKNLSGWTVQSGATMTVAFGLVFDNTDVSNSGTFDFSTTASAALSVINGSDFTNSAGGTVIFRADAINVATAGSGGTLVNAGTIQRLSGTGTLNISPTTFSNSGTLDVGSGEVLIPSFIAVPQLSADQSTLLGGTWKVSGGASIRLIAAETTDAFNNPLSKITTNAATVEISGAGTVFRPFSNLSANTGTLRLLNGATFTTAAQTFNPPTNPMGPLPGPLTNSGTIEIGAGATLAVTENFTQTGAGTLRLHVAGASASGHFGKVTTTGQAALGGTLELMLDGAFVPTQGQNYALLSYGSVAGDFAVLNGVQPVFTPTRAATAYTFAVGNLSGLADLVPQSIVVPANGLSGQNVTINFQVQNAGADPTNAATWTDSIYLSRSAIFDSSAVLFGRVPHTGALSGGASYADAITAAVPALLPGVFHVFVVTDSRSQVAETDNANNTLISAGSVNVDVPVLTPGVPLNASITDGQELLFRVDLPDASSRVQVAGALAGQAELFLRFGALPTVSASDAFAFDPLSTTQSLTVADSLDGNYFILVRGRASAALTLTADALPFSLTGVGPFAGTNNGTVTLTIRGAQLSTATALSLVPNFGGAVLTPVKVQVRDATSVFATFDLTGAAPGNYDVQAVSGADTQMLDNAFNVLAAPVIDSGLQVTLSFAAPAAIRLGRTATVLVSFSNPTGHDLIAPLLVLISDNGSFSFPGNPGFHSDYLELMALGDGADPGVLAPGFRGGQYVTFLPEVQGEGLVSNFLLTEVDRAAPVDYGRVELLLRPVEISDAAWAPVLASLKTRLGTTYGQYEDVLAAVAKLLPPELGDAREPLALLALPLAQAFADAKTSIRGVAHSADPLVDVSGREVIATNLDTLEQFSTTSLNDGSFALSGISAGHYTLQFDGALIANPPALLVSAGDHVANVALDLSKGAAVSGSILAGAEIEVLAADGTFRATVADANGAYSLGGLADGIYTLIFTAPGKARQVIENVAVSGGGVSLDVSLADEGRIAGSVTSGNPTGDTFVIARPIGDSDPLHVFGASVTGGQFTFTGLPAGAYDLTISHPGDVVKIIGELTVAAGQTNALGNIALIDGATISGIVTSTDPAQPASGLTVVAKAGGVVLASAATDSSGNYTLSDLAAGTYDIEVVGNGAFQVPVSVALGSGEDRAGVGVAVKPGGSITGVVTDTATGAALAGVPVFATASDGRVVNALTDSTGHYLFENLATGNYHLFVRFEGAAAGGDAALPTLDSAITGVDLHGAVAARITGTLLLADGGIASGGVVSLKQNGETIATATADGSGHYLFLLENPGTYDLQAFAGDAVFAVMNGVVVGAGATATEDLTSGAATLAVTVTSGAGSLDGTVLLIKNAASGEIVGFALVDENGLAQFSHLPAGNYVAEAFQGDARGAQMNVTVGASGSFGVTVPLAAQGIVSGTVTINGGAGMLHDGYVALYPAGGGAPVIVPIGTDGSYLLSNVQPGSYDLVTFADGYAVNVATGITIAAGQTARDVVLQPGTTTVTGRIVDASGTPITATSVNVTDAAGHVLGTGLSLADGTFEITSAVGSGLRAAAQADGGRETTLATGLNLSGGQTLALGNFTYDLLATGGSPAASAFLAATVEAASAHSLLTAPSTLSALGSFGLPTIQTPTFITVLQHKDLMHSESEVKSISPPPPGACGDACQSAYDAAVKAKEKQDRTFMEAKEQEMQLRDQAARSIGIFLGELGTDVKNVGLGYLGLAALAGIGVPLGAGVVAGLAYAGLADFVADLSRIIFADDAKDVGSAAERGALDSAKAVTSYANLLKSLNPEVVGQLKFGGPIASALNLLFNGQKVVSALNLTASRDAAQFLDGLKTNYDNAVQQYYDAVSNAIGKRDDYERCKANSGGDNAECNPPPPPPPPPSGPPGAPGKPVVPVPSQPIRQVRSVDPNDIIGPGGFGDAHFVAATATLPYTIHFENVATASASAAEVFVTETLDADLDFSTFRVTQFGFGGKTYVIPDGRSSFTQRVDAVATLGVFVDFSASIDLQTGTVHWSLSAIDPATGDVPGDASLGFLPPNISGGQGEGFVSYSVSAKTGAHTGDTIDAHASIVFDANDAIETPSIFNTIDATAPITHVETISANGTSGPDFTVRWSGADDAGGSGLATFEVFVSDNGGKFEPLLLGTTYHAAIFSGVVGHTYDFVVSGLDGAGNHEALPPVADASVMVVAGTTFTLDAAHAVQVHDSTGKLVTIKLSGHGSGVVSLVNGVLDAADLRAIVLTDTDIKTALKITTASGGSVNVGRITSAGALGSISLSSSVVLGDGYDDGADDFVIGGAVKSLALGDIAAFTQLKIGGTLSDVAVAQTTLNVKFRDALGEGITTDFATKVGVVNVLSWAFDGVLGSRQSVAGLNVTAGDFRASVDVDGGGLYAGTATLGPVNIKAGGLFGTAFQVEGALGNLKIKGAVSTQLSAASIGAIGAGSIGASTIAALSGNIGNITVSSGPLASSTIRALGGSIGNITAKLSNQTADVASIDTNLIEARSIGNLTASVTGTMTIARGFFGGLFHATTGNIGNISASVTGTALTDGIAIDIPTFASDGGSIGAITAKASSPAATAQLAAIRETDFFAHNNLGNVSAVALVTSRSPVSGRAAAIQAENFDVNFNAGGSIGKISASAGGAAEANVALDVASTQRVNFNASTDIGAVTLKVSKGRATASVNEAAAFANFIAGRNIGAFNASGDATTTQLDSVVARAGGSIAGLNVSAKNKDAGTVSASFFFAGQGRSIVVANDLRAAGIGFIKVSGSFENSQIVASGNLGAIAVGKNADRDWFVAGADVSGDAIFLTGDDSYNAHASIASLTVGGRFAMSTVAAGIAPGADFLFGTSNDFAGATGGLSTRSKIGAVKIGAASGAGTPILASLFDHTDAIESLALKSLKIGTSAVVTAFTSNGAVIDLDSNGIGDAGEVVVRTV